MLRESRLSNPSWQLCPKCNGCGYLTNMPSTIINMRLVCDLCNGKKIININSGLPPCK